MTSTHEFSRRLHEEDYDEDCAGPDAGEVADLLQSLVTGEIDKDEFDTAIMGSEEEAVNIAESFADAGVLTTDKGFRFDLPDGRTVHVKVWVQ